MVRVWASHTSPSNNYERFAGLFSLSVKAPKRCSFVWILNFWFHSYLLGIFFSFASFKKSFRFTPLLLPASAIASLPSLAKSLNIWRISHISVGPTRVQPQSVEKIEISTVDWFASLNRQKICLLVKWFERQTQFSHSNKSIKRVRISFTFRKSRLVDCGGVDEMK